MKHITLTPKAFLFLALVFFVQGFSNLAGGDYCKVLLNNKLLTEQFLYKPIALKTVLLTPSPFIILIAERQDWAAPFL
jgi:hypothetical protein